jgi:2-oxoglutarate dehydrogenase complex dehydrogenase (E1) component-like enzyme
MGPEMDSDSMERPQAPARSAFPVPSAPPSDSDPLASFGVNAAVVEEIRQRYEIDPASVDPAWASLFDAERSLGDERLDRRTAEKYARVLRLIHAYRARGHRIAEIDPLGGRASSYFPELDPAHYGLGTDDLDRPFLAGDLPGGPVQTLREILDRLRATYCRTVGVEFTHI